MQIETFQARFAEPMVLAIAALAGVAVLELHLLSALFAGMLVFLIVHSAAPLFGRRFSHQRGKLLATAALATLVILGLFAALMGLLALAHGPGGGLPKLWDQLAVSMQSGRAALPPWITDHMPDNVDELKGMALNWLNTHTSELSLMGKEAGITLAQVLVGMVIGALVAVHEHSTDVHGTPFAKALQLHSQKFHEAFRDVVGAQIKIALINVTLTAIFLVVVLPIAGIHMPLVKTLIAITFVVGMLPVVGNIISNTMIVMVGLSVSLAAAGLSMLFLVVLHKGEYFLNARIVGTRIDAKPWELLLAFLVMEAAFGLPGIAAAPIFYAYLKRELVAAGWL